MLLILVIYSNESKEAKIVNKYVVAKISHNEYKDVLLNVKCLVHSVNRIQSKNHQIGTCEIKQNSFVLL